MNKKIKEVNIGNRARDLLLCQSESIVQWFKTYGLIHYCGECYKVILPTKEEILNRIDKTMKIIEPYSKVPWFIKIYRIFKNDE